MTENQKPNIATMTADELERYIADLDKKHKARMTSLRALQRARKAEEESDGIEIHKGA